MLQLYGFGAKLSKVKVAVRIRVNNNTACVRTQWMPSSYHYHHFYIIIIIIIITITRPVSWICTWRWWWWQTVALPEFYNGGADDRGAKGAEVWGLCPLPRKKMIFFTWNRWILVHSRITFLRSKRHKKRHTRPICQVNGGRLPPTRPRLESDTGGKMMLRQTKHVSSKWYRYHCCAGATMSSSKFAILMIIAILGNLVPVNEAGPAAYGLCQTACMPVLCKATRRQVLSSARW